MSSLDFFIGMAVALFCGLDRTAILQVMVSRPIVAAPLVGWLLGAPQVGLQIGMMVELLWLARLPVGAAIPPDDTQVSVASTVLAVNLGPLLGTSGSMIALLCLLVALPLGKVGQYLDHLSRQFNVGLLDRAEACLANGQLWKTELQHLRGVINFALAGLVTYLLVMVGGFLLVPILWPLVEHGLQHSSSWLQLALPLIGVAVILGTINVSRALTLFCASFGMAFLLLWLV